MVPGPGHPGHFPKPPGWIDRPGGAAADKGATNAGAPAGQKAPPPGPPAAGSRAAEAAAKVAELLRDEDEELADEVTRAEEAVEQDIGALAAAEAQRDEYLDSLKRLQADFENYKKRVSRQQLELKDRAAEDLVQKLLPSLDNFDLALAHAESGSGLEQVHRSLVGVLEGAGLERLEPVGQPFDPNEHDAVLHEEGDGEAPEVIEVMRAGYRWKGRVLRPAMVKVKG